MNIYDPLFEAAKAKGNRDWNIPVIGSRHVGCLPDPRTPPATKKPFWRKSK